MYKLLALLLILLATLILYYYTEKDYKEFCENYSFNFPKLPKSKFLV